MHRERNLPEGLDAVDVEGDPVLPGDPPDLLDRHDGADLAVRVHDGDQDRVRAEGPPDIVRIYQAELVDRKVGHGITRPLQRLTGPQHGVVLHRRRDDVPPVVRVGHTLDRQVVRLGPAGGEADLLGKAVEEGGDGLAGLLQGLAGGALS